VCLTHMSITALYSVP